MNPHRRRVRLTERNQRVEPTPGTKVSTHASNPKAIKKKRHMAAQLLRQEKQK